ncbi:MAG TPA: endoribonuclease MazF [Thermoanaerobaculia bacterium]
MATRSGRRPYIPERGDVVWLTFDPQAGHEQAGRRPAVVLSPSRYNDRSGLALIVPITTHVKGYPFEVALPAGLRLTGAVLADHLKSLDWHARKAEYLGKLPEAILAEIIRRASLLLTG